MDIASLDLNQVTAFFTCLSLLPCCPNIPEEQTHPHFLLCTKWYAACDAFRIRQDL